MINSIFCVVESDQTRRLSAGERHLATAKDLKRAALAVLGSDFVHVVFLACSQV